MSERTDIVPVRQSVVRHEPKEDKSPVAQLFEWVKGFFKWFFSPVPEPADALTAQGVVFEPGLGEEDLLERLSARGQAARESHDLRASAAEACLRAEKAEEELAWWRTYWASPMEARLRMIGDKAREEESFIDLERARFHRRMASTQPPALPAPAPHPPRNAAPPPRVETVMDSQSIEAAAIELLIRLSKVPIGEREEAWETAQEQMRQGPRPLSAEEIIRRVEELRRLAR